MSRPAASVVFEPAAVLAHILKLPKGKAGLKHLYKDFRAQGDRRALLEHALEALLDSGDLIEISNGHFQAAALSRDFATGRVSVHRDGFGFLIPDKPIPGVVGDIYLNRDALKGAMHGDRALIRVGRVGPGGKTEGEVHQVMRRAHPTVVGEFRITKRGLWVVPHDSRMQDWVEIPVEYALPPAGPQHDRIGVEAREYHEPSELDGLIVNAELLEYGENPVGRIIEVLGAPDSFGIDVEIIIRKHHLPHHFPPEVIDQARAISETIPAAELDAKRRQDFRHLPIVTIDGETARDFDDAILVDLLPNGHYALQVHIADVSHYVLPGSPIDSEARLRGTSVYFPDRAVPMLPHELSTNICSLMPQQDRLVMSALIEFDHTGQPVSQRFCRGVIRSVERMTYTSVHKLLTPDTEPGDAELKARYKPLLERFERMKEFAEILMRRRFKRGSIDFDLPEPLIEFDQFGEMVGITRSARNIAHRIIEEFMLAANEAVAAHLSATGRAAIYRIHEQPDPKRVLEFEEVAAQFGVSLGIGAMPVNKFRYKERKAEGGSPYKKAAYKDVIIPKEVAISPRNYQRLVAQIEGKPEERILSFLMLRSLRQARYSEANEGHFALATEFYTHFTSPIRRYPDLIVHRLLAATLDQTTYSDEAEIKAVATDCSMNERRAADAERELVEWKKAKFMESRVGEEFDALLISTTRFGAFVELTDLFVEGLVPIDSLPGDRYTWHENTRKIIGQRTRREFSMGDKVRVILDRVDPLERKLQFAIVDNRRPEPKSKVFHKRKRPY